MVEVYNSTSRYLHDILKIANNVFDGKVNQMYSTVSIHCPRKSCFFFFEKEKFNTDDKEGK